MFWSPASRPVVVKVDFAALGPVTASTDPAPSGFAPSKNSTVPVGEPPLPLVFVTVAVKVTGPSKSDGSLLDATVVAVAASTTWAVAPLLPAKSLDGV